MAKVSKATAAKVDDFPVATERSSELEGYAVSFVEIKQTHDLGPMLAVLPGGHCTCPHWGYVIKGRVTVVYGDRRETIEAGEAFYMPPGHVPGAEAGSEFVLFSPADELAATDAAVRAGMAARSA